MSGVVLSAEADRLAELFPCLRFVALFPTGMPKRACLRRQLEFRAVKDGKGKVVAWEPVHVHCATTCDLGRANRAALGTPASTCENCGAARIGSQALESCPACAATPEGPPRRAEVSKRLWNGEEPDVPIAPPPRASVGLSEGETAEVTENVREAMKHPTRVATPKHPPIRPEDPPVHVEPPAPHAPAQPATPKETTMPCSNCGSTAHNKRTCEKPTEPTKPAPTAKAAKPRPSKPAPKAPAVRKPRAAGAGDLPVLSVPELLDLRRAIDSEIRARLETVEVERKALLEALDADAKVLRGEAA